MPMRKVQSAPQLHIMDAAHLSCSAAARHPGSPRTRHTHANAVQKRPLKVIPETGFLQARGTAGLGRRCCSSNALPLLAPIPPPPLDSSTTGILADVFEQADELLEEFVWAKGLIPAGECFEQFGWTESAPPLKDVSKQVTEEQRKGLASCLATPFMYDDEHLSKRAQETVMKRGQMMEQRLTDRFAEEVQSEQEEREVQNTSSYAGQEAVARSRRRRRLDQMSIFGSKENQAPFLAGRATSPDTHRRLSEALSHWDINKNKLHLDEQILAAKKQGLATSSLDPASMSMEAADEALFIPDDAVHCASPDAGGVLAASRDHNTMLVQQDKAADTLHIEDGPETNLDSFEFEVNEFKANAYLTAADQQEGDTTDAKANESADLAAMQAPVQNNIVPFLLARIAQALE